MAYFLDFDERALKEWRKLGSTVREQLKKKLVEVLESPRIEANKLRGMPDCYKIKLRSSGYRLVYQVKWFTEFGHLNRGDMLTSEQHRCHNEKKKFQRRV
ncbi:type II toxin-antitoxin system RelE family toxin [Escherichia coli]|uniref:type II toxin-antitoxin system RelE family toxin n=1 Tax=Escherichia coli TaxID=562 RepID=UPI003D9F6C73